MSSDPSKKSFSIRVECYAGYKGEEQPTRFFLGERALEVTEILDRWYQPDSADFKVKSSDGKIYILRHHQGEDSYWTLESLVGGNP
jgi:hypothetical protein